jgi:hypothetical protein
LVRFKSSFGSESGSITSNYGSGSSKKFRILADPDLDPDPQHWLWMRISKESGGLFVGFGSGTPGSAMHLELDVNLSRKIIRKMTT